MRVFEIDGDDDYKWLMQKAFEFQNDKLIGMSKRPSNVEILARFITELRNFTEQYLGEKIELALSSHRNSQSSSEEALDSAFEVAEMTHLSKYKLRGGEQAVAHSYVAIALVGLDFGICEHRRDFRMCEAENIELPWKQALVISLTEDSLTVTNVLIAVPHRAHPVQETVHWDLGFGKRRNNPSDEPYWPRVRDVIQNVPVASRTPDLLILTGEGALHESFLRSLKQALRNMKLHYLYGRWIRMGREALFLAARGAAHLARVWQGSTNRCSEMLYCSDLVA